jgi:hypothetical protein
MTAPGAFSETTVPSKVIELGGSSALTTAITTCRVRAKGGVPESVAVTLSVTLASVS